MPKMRLDTYDFEWNPAQYTIPKVDKSYSVVPTYETVAFFSWGTKLVGKEIVLEWDMMPDAQFSALQSILELEGEVVWTVMSGEATAYNVNVCALDGKFIEKSIHDAPYRTDVKLTMVIMSEV